MAFKDNCLHNAIGQARKQAMQLDRHENKFRINSEYKSARR
jgi:hypothetical protein